MENKEKQLKEVAEKTTNEALKKSIKEKVQKLKGDKDVLK